MAAVNKVVYGKTTLIDLTGDTVDEKTLFKGCTAHKSNGTIVVGKMFEGYPDTYSLYEGMTDTSGDNILDSSGTPISGRTIYKKV